MADAATPQNTGEEFEAAKVVSEKLRELGNRDRQERVLRWVAEGLGITNPVAPPIPPAPATLPLDTPPAVPGGGQSTTDIRSFVKEKKPRTDIQFVTVVAHYYRFEAPENQRHDTINTEIAQQATRLADWDRLTNPQSTLSNAVNQGYLNRSSPGEFGINTVGENLVARTLPEDRSAPKAGRNKKTAKSATKKKR